MSTLQMSAPISTRSQTGLRRSAAVLRLLHTVIEAIGETNRRRAEREIAKVARSRSLVAARLRD